MFKKVLALTLAAVMLLMPMTASAVTWRTLVGSLGGVDGTKTVEDTMIKKDSESITVSGGTVEFDDQQNWVGGRYLYNFNNVLLKDFTAAVVNEGEYMEIYFGEGTVAEGIVHLNVQKNGAMTLGNDAEINGTIQLEVYDDANGGIYNLKDGIVNGAIDITADGENAEANLLNEGKTYNIVLDAQNGGSIEAENNAHTGAIFAGAAGEGSSVLVTNDASVGNAIADLFNGGSVAFTGDGAYNRSIIYLDFDGKNTLSQQEIADIVDSVGLYGKGEKENRVQLFEFENDCLTIYDIAEDGSLTVVDVIYFDDDEEEEPEPEPDPIELQRQAEGIGGVTTSPVWNWQGYLGHSSKPMWIYINGEKVLMRQRLFWLGDSTKNHTCRINVAEPDPASIELRVGLDMLRTAQRAEISVISILDKDSNPIAQFAVSDLLGAFEQYGLEEGELLCVSADPDAEVMKVTLDGEYLPLEEAEEENAAA